MKVSDFFSLCAQSLKSLVKVTLCSRRCPAPEKNSGSKLIILGNGPSLNTTLDESADILRHNNTMSVNFAPISDVFFDIRPVYHVLADPVFFEPNKNDNVDLLYRQLARVDWPLTLLIPVQARKALPSAITANSNIKISPFNLVGASGFASLERWLYNRRLAMPRPRNVLVPAIMCGIWAGYTSIYIAGADHSWMQTIRVDDDNNVISVQPHFYKDDEKEQKRVDTIYRNYRLDQIVESFAIAFRSYHTIEKYARSRGVKIYNCTPGSYIDAFERRPL